MSFIIGGLLVLLISFHFWFINHAETFIEDMVSSQSNGKLHLKVKKFKFNWFSKHMELENAHFFSTDTATNNTAYDLVVQKVKLSVKGVLPFLIDKQLLIDSLSLIKPAITVTQLRSKQSSSDTASTPLSIPQEMGKVYNSIQEALDVLDVRMFYMENAAFTLLNNTRPNEIPLHITNINLRLNNIFVSGRDSLASKKILFSDNLTVTTHKQNIHFPDGRHILSFKNFELDVQHKMVEFDECTIEATESDNKKSTFAVFFEKLKLTNLNFDSLYHKEIIQADSVYCTRPTFKLDITLPGNKDSATAPQIDKLIQQLTGDIALKNVIIKDGSFDIRTERNGVPNTFTSEHNNFELKGLKILQHAPKPIAIEQFNMGIRNFENFLKDSTYSIQFDSILFYNNQINLNKFVYHELKNNKPLNTISMDRFSLDGLSWDHLVLERVVKAANVTLVNPVIQYTLLPQKKYNNNTIYETLAGLGKQMQLQQLHIKNGQIEVILPDKSKFNLYGANFSILGEKLVQSTRIADIQEALQTVYFTRGVYKNGNTSIQLQDIRFSGTENKLLAKTVTYQDKSGTNITAGDVSIDAFSFDEKLNNIVINQLGWSNARASIISHTPQQQQAINRFVVQQVRGNNTQLHMVNKGSTINAYLDKISCSRISNTGQQSGLIINGLVTSGKDLSLSTAANELRIGFFDIKDGQASTVRDISFSNISPDDSLLVRIPEIKLNPDINAILAQTTTAKDIVITDPVLRYYRKKENNDVSVNPKIKFPAIRVNNLLINNPQVHYYTVTENGTTSITWQDREAKSRIQLQHILSKDGQTIEIGNTNLAAQGIAVLTANKHLLKSDNGSFAIELDNTLLTATETGTIEWETHLKHFTANKLVFDSLQENKTGSLVINKARLSNITIKPLYLLRPYDLISNNADFSLSEVTGSYQNDLNRFNWYNLRYQKSNSSFTIDSFAYSPLMSRDEFVKQLQYQADYLQAKTKSIHIGPFNWGQYIKDSSFNVGSIVINDGYISTFRDKRIPRHVGAVKPLPVGRLKSIPIKLAVDSITLQNGLVQYEEINEKTNSVGRINVNRLNSKIYNASNYDHTATDSLYIYAHADLEEVIATDLYVAQSYRDSASGFYMTVDMGEADLTSINPILASLASAKFKSGKIDSLKMQVTGNDDYAYGTMDMKYKNIRIQLFKNGDEHNKNVLTRVLSFVANTFVIKKNNKNRTGIVFFERLKDRSSINYLVKTTLNGVINSTGATSKSKQRKKYKRALKK
ncbi:hypothetical protein ACFS6H_11520 [Terrimonas rubra]|uniref:AsmA-like C-terminal region n=1 Tax=Terrimonas rubra TaxID=1035890 RepID=A0ABW6A4U2_9BACT